MPLPPAVLFQSDALHGAVGVGAGVVEAAGASGDGYGCPKKAKAIPLWWSRRSALPMCAATGASQRANDRSSHESEQPAMLPDPPPTAIPMPAVARTELFTIATVPLLEAATEALRPTCRTLSEYMTSGQQPRHCPLPATVTTA